MYSLLNLFGYWTLNKHYYYYYYNISNAIWTTGQDFAFSTGHDKYNADYFNIVNNNVNEINTYNRIRRSEDDSSSSNRGATTVTMSPIVDEVRF